LVCFHGGGNGDIRVEELSYERRVGGASRIADGEGGV